VEIYHENSEIESAQNRLAEFFDNTLIRQLQLFGGFRSELGSDLIPGLDAVFLGRDSNDYVRTDMFGLTDCVGVKLIKDDTELDDFRKEIRKIENQFDEANMNGARVAYLKNSDIDKWLKFYEQVSQDRNLSTLESKKFEMSGLARGTVKHFRLLKETTENWLNSASEYFKSYGVTHFDKVVNDDGRVLMDIGFYDIIDQLQFVPLYHLRQKFTDEGDQETWGEIFPEVISSEPMFCPGVMILRPGENKRELYERVKRVKDQMLKTGYITRDEYDSVTIPAITHGQLRLWGKLGEAGMLEAQYGECGLTTEELVQFLFFGKNSYERGKLTKLGFSVPSVVPANGNGKYHFPIDVVCVVDGDEKPRVRTIPVPMLGLNLSKLKEKTTLDYDEVPTTPLGDVAGFVIMPDGLNKEEMKERLKLLEGAFAGHTGNVNAHLMIVTPKLFELWQKRDSCFAGNEEVEKFVTQEPKRAREYGIRKKSSESKWLYARFQPGAVVGGMTDCILEWNGNTLYVYHTNRGLNFSDAHPYGKEMNAQPGADQTLYSMIDRAVISHFPGTYNESYVVRSLLENSQVWFDSPNDYAMRDLRLSISLGYELGTHPHEWFEEALGTKKLNRILELGKKDLNNWLNVNQVIVEETFINHTHIDHIGHLAILHENSKFVTRDIIAANLRGLSAAASTGLREYAEIKDVSKPVSHGTAYPSIPRPIIELYNNDQFYPFNDGAEARFARGNHSTDVIFMLFKLSNGISMLNTGDVRMGKLTDAAVEHFAGKADVIIAETTNGPETSKPNQGKSEVDVSVNIENIIRESQGKLVIVSAAKNNHERLMGIIRAARSNNRRVAMVPSFAHLGNHMSMELKDFPLTSDARNDIHPSLFNDYALYKTVKSSRMSYEKTIIGLAEILDEDSSTEMVANGHNIVDHEELSNNPGEWVVVVSPYDLLDKVMYGVQLQPFNGPDGWTKRGFAYVHASSASYEQKTTNLYAMNYDWVKQRGGDYYADFEFEGSEGKLRIVPRSSPAWFMPVHVTGHAYFKDMVERVIFPLLGRSYKGKTIILTHGPHPVIYKQEQLKKLAELENRCLLSGSDYIKNRTGGRVSDLKIIAQLDRTDYKNPLFDPEDKRVRDLPLKVKGFYYPLR
jgi:hypothetical protein